MRLLNVLAAMATVAGFCLPATGSAQASSLIGETVYACSNSVYSGNVYIAQPYDCSTSTVYLTPGSAVIGDGVEFQLGADRSIDFGANTLTINYGNVSDSSPDLFVFTDLPFITYIELLTPDPLGVEVYFNQFSPYRQLNVLVTKPVTNGSSVTFKLYPFDDPVSTVPLPAGALLLPVGLGVLGLMRSRSRSRKPA